MRILITICARGGSKGIPGKNVKILNNKPLISYTIEVAKQFQQKYNLTDIALSTDSDEIKNVAAECGLESDYTRPSSLAGDSVGKIDVIKNLLLWQENRSSIIYDYVLDMDVTSPLRNLIDLSNSFNILQKNDEALNLFSVNPANRSPYFNMVEKKENGFYSLVKKANSDILTRQSAPKVYGMNASFYFYKRGFFDLGYKSAITDKSLIYEMPHTCFDLDHPMDFEFMNYLMKNNKLDFEL
jgi:CMP-N-acetylneuraminic acid synthetase